LIAYFDIILNQCGNSLEVLSQLGNPHYKRLGVLRNLLLARINDILVMLYCWKSLTLRLLEGR
jgi:hypothetical protein